MSLFIVWLFCGMKKIIGQESFHPRPDLSYKMILSDSWGYKWG